MDDIMFPAWASTSSSLAMASVLGVFFRQTNAAAHAEQLDAQLRTQGMTAGEVSVSKIDVRSRCHSSQHYRGENAVGSDGSDSDSQGKDEDDVERGAAAFLDATGSGPFAFSPPNGTLYHYSFNCGGGDGGAIAGRLLPAPPAGFGLRSQRDGVSSDILHDARVEQLFRLSCLDAITTGELPCVTRKHAVAILALMGLCVECRDLPGDLNRGFYTESSALYSSLMSKLHDLKFAKGIDVEGFVSALTACGLKMRGSSSSSSAFGGGVGMEDVSQAGSGRGGGTAAEVNKNGNNAPHNGMRKSLTGSGSSNGLGTPRPANSSACGFDLRIIDGIVLACIPECIDTCVRDPVALGALQGLAGTYSRSPVFLGAKLVGRLHDLTDAFAVSEHRRELPYKRLLSLLLEAISCSERIDYARTNSWISAIIQEDYVVRGLFQREILHARVVAATLALLTRQYQEMAADYTATCSFHGGSSKNNNNVASGNRQDGGGTGLPDFKDGDALIESVWRALQEGVTTWEHPSQKVSTLYGANVRVVVEQLLKTEVERLKCFYLIGCAQHPLREAAQVVRCYGDGNNGNTAKEGDFKRVNSNALSISALAGTFATSPVTPNVGGVNSGENGASTLPNTVTMYSPSREEEALRVRVISNIVKLLLLPTSVINLLHTTKEAAHKLRNFIADVASAVLTILANARFVSLGDTCNFPQLTARFSNRYYQNLASVLHEMVLVVSTRQGGGDGVVAVGCLRSLCAADPHLRSFVVSEVMDSVVRLSAVQEKNKQATTATGQNGSGGGIEEESRQLSLCLDLLCDVLVPKRPATSPATDPTATEDLARYGQLLCDSYEDALRNHLRLAQSKDGVAAAASGVPTDTMTVAAQAMWRLAGCVHERIRAAAHDALCAADAGDTDRKKRCLAAINADGDHVRLLLRSLLRCVVNIAWPGSGILYQRFTSAGGQRRSSGSSDGAATSGPSSRKVLGPLAMKCISPLLRSMCLLSHLATLFPVSRVGSLVDHDERAQFLTAADACHDQYMYYYQFRPSKLKTAYYTEFGTSLFRSFWLLLTYYGFTAKARLTYASIYTVHTATKASAVCDPLPPVTELQCQQIRLLAASAVPLLLMRSSDLHQATADVATLLRFADMGDAAATRGTKHRTLRTELQNTCGGSSKRWEQLTMAELFLMRALTDLELLRASAGSIATLTLYSHYDVREYVASPAICHVVTRITSTVSTEYISALRSMMPTVAQRLVAQDTQQLVLLLSFSVSSVREAARSILELIVGSVPSFAINCSSLAQLWGIINILEGCTASQVEHLCKRLHVSEVPAVSPDPRSTERMVLVQMLCDVARYWVARTQSSSPLVLFERATRFVMRQDCAGTTTGAASGGLLTSTANAHWAAGFVGQGSRLAIEAAQPKEARLPPEALKGAAAIGSVTIPDYAQVLIKHSSAQGQVLAAARQSPLVVVERGTLMQLQAAVRRARRSDGLQAALARNKRRAAEGHNKGACHAAGRAGAYDRETTDRAIVSPVKVSEVDALVSTAVALLCTGQATPTGTLQLLRYTVQGPIHIFRSEYINAATTSWRWLVTNGGWKRFAVPLLLQLTDAVEWTVHHRLGLFDGLRPSLSNEVQTGDTSATSSLFGVGDGGVMAPDYTINSPHKVVFAFLADLYVSRNSPVALDPLVLTSLYQMASCIVADPSRFSLKPSSFFETMRCCVLVGQIAQNLQMANMRRLKAGLPVVVPFTSIGILRQRWYACLLQWFRSTPPPWYLAMDPAPVEEEAVVLEALVKLLNEERGCLTGSPKMGFLDFSVGVRSGGGGTSSVWSAASVVRVRIGAILSSGDKAEAALTQLIHKEHARLANVLALLAALVQHELVRSKVWLAPRRTLLITERMPLSFAALVDTAASQDPAVMVAMVKRFASYLEVFNLASEYVVASPSKFAHIPEAVELYLTQQVLEAGAPKLFLFVNCGIVQALRLLDRRYKAYPIVETYAIRSLLSQKSEHLIFYLPQLLQVLAADQGGSIQNFLLRMSRKSVTFCHQLLWALQTEGEADSVLGHECKAVEMIIKDEMTPEQFAFCKGEFQFTNLVTSLSGELMKYDKPQRKPKLRERLKDEVFHTTPKTQHLYLPTDPSYRITDVVAHTASAMQSAAKCPIFIQFTCVPRDHEDMTLPTETTAEAEDGLQQQQQPIVKACIFKMGDDCRQDQISLQLIGLMQRILNAIEVPSYLYPYRVVTTGQESGIIECVPRSMSRNEIGKLVESNLAEFFVQTFGHPESVSFHRARDNFVKSAASYSVVSYILNIKDRHNGNIMIDAEGHLVHIDFGFLFDTSPGGDMNFESSPFKLTTEMVQLIGRDVGTTNLRSRTLEKALVDEENYIYFKTLVNRCYLAIRQYAREICILVELMLQSGLPCFKPHKTIADLAKRLSMGKNEIEAADFMRKRIHEARENYRTVLYDQYQRIAEGIEM